ncbi:hypothetical protein HWB52_gp94 [Pseudomonas phage Littlefix]|uniref:Uncharacterized protein n=1 Tax=Pseudomonas phage Littlefix TaxID=2079289 RepID=A0A2K9VHX3_9CAUD|nr:hypothetical protein HWB52_gp94 [Pseudomonas phage Littlefix]AUV61909.1 hypothetical protein PsPhLittlefix_gp94 [Pseudomonas phage Littlefix]
MSEFKLEDRYLVIKRSHLSQRQIYQLQKLLGAESIPTVECLVLEPDWPEHQVALAAIAERVNGESQ